MKDNFDYNQAMTVADLIDYLLTLDGDLQVTSSIFKPMSGLVHKAPLKFSQLKVGRGQLYINNYLNR